MKTDHNYRNLFNGIHRFLTEDFLVLHPNKTRNRVRSECKLLAYEVIQRSNAWSNVISERFPHALRLSIHPQPRDSDKIGIHLVKTDDSWRTPWHSVAVHDGTQFRLMKRSEAESAGAFLVSYKGHPSHFKLTSIDRKEAIV